jgi:hypothetical protein
MAQYAELFVINSITFVDMDMSYTWVILIKVAYRVPRK